MCRKHAVDAIGVIAEVCVWQCGVVFVELVGFNGYVFLILILKWWCWKRKISHRTHVVVDEREEIV